MQNFGRADSKGLAVLRQLRMIRLSQKWFKDFAL